MKTKMKKTAKLFFIAILLLTCVHVSAQKKHKYVDLGLPSGTMWATCNLGANNPEDYGDYLAWGENTPKAKYNWSNYKFCKGSNKTLTRNCNNPKFGYNGFIDNYYGLNGGDDPACHNWGLGWHIPSIEHWEELYNNTTSTWTCRNGVYGMLFTGRNGKSIFLPAAGYRTDGELNLAGSNCVYWSDAILSWYSRDKQDYGRFDNTPSRAMLVGFKSDRFYQGNDERCYGLPVRPIYEDW